MDKFDKSLTYSYKEIGVDFFGANNLRHLVLRIEEDNYLKLIFEDENGKKPIVFMGIDSIKYLRDSINFLYKEALKVKKESESNDN